MPNPDTERKRRWRARKRGVLEPVPTCACGRKMLGDREMCRACWLKTDEGKEYTRQKVQRHRSR